MRRVVLVAGLCFCGCDKPPPPTVEREPAPAPVVLQRPVEPATVEPSAPDFEDAAGKVKQTAGGWIIEVEGSRPICLPFEAPAEARVDGVDVRFTLYLSADRALGCRPVETLISMRVE